jgi:predicted DNA-binding transcriptional regulator YafY
VGRSLKLLQLLEVLVTNPGISVPAMAVELEVCERTVFRYLDALSTDLMIPLYCEDGGYFLNGRPFFGPLNLSPEEMLATALSLKSFPASATRPFSSHARSALRKIECAVNGGVLKDFRELAERSSVQPTAHAHPETVEVMEGLLDATIKRQRLEVTHYSHRLRADHTLEFEPYALTFRRHAWYVVGRSLEHDKVIQLKILRISRVKPTGGGFQVPADFNVEDFYRCSWEVWTGQPETTVRVRFSGDVADMVAEVSRHPSQTVERCQDGSIIFCAKVSGTAEIGAWILGWGDHAEVLEPRELRRQIAGQVCRLSQLYKEEFTEDSLD